MPVGEYYLQQADSPCVNAGSELASAHGFDQFTTSIDNILDSGQVDMGYHHRPNCVRLNAAALAGYGLVAPVRMCYINGTVVAITAVPERGYKVKQWTGTDDDSSTSSVNTVTMDSDITVTVEFEFAATRTLVVPGNYLELQSAIDAAVDGDVIILNKGVWPWGGFRISDKVIMVTGTNPDDPNVVAETVIDCEDYYQGGSWSWVDAGGFYFGPGSGSSILNGITIRGARGGYGAYDYYDPYYGYSSWSYGGGAITTTQGTSPRIANCVITEALIYGGDGGTWVEEIPAGFNGYPGINGGNAYGAGIYVGPRSSPTIINCTISDCQVIGGDGGPGQSGGGYDEGLFRVGDGGRGGWPGAAYGGGIYCASQSNPTVIGCTINGCQAIGGDGGDAGNAGDSDFYIGYGGYGGGWSSSAEWDYWRYGEWDPYYYYYYYYYYFWRTQERSFFVEGELWEHWGYAEAPWYYSGQGGGVYVAADSDATFVDCTISNNTADGGLNGIGGLDGGGWRERPIYRYDIPGLGGGAYCATNSLASFETCRITGNTVVDHSVAEPDLDVDPNDPNDPNAPAEPNDPNEGPVEGDYQRVPYSGYGGGFCLRGTAETMITDCTFSQNQVGSGFGGAIDSVNSDVTISASDFTENLAMKGGALSSFEDQLMLTASRFTGNLARASGEGGALYLFTTNAYIADSVFTDNQAEWSGGGLYLAGATDSPDSNTLTILSNCLITQNLAGRDGGGVSCNWYVEPIIRNCTISDNRVSRVPSYGAGLYSSYGADVQVIDSIIWNNVGRYAGAQIAVGSGDPAYQLCGKAEVTYSDIGPSYDEGGVSGLDIVFCIDTTNSMWNELVALKDSMTQIIDEVAGQTNDFRIGVVEYRDYPPPPDNDPNPAADPNYWFIYRDVSQFTNNISSLIADINNIEAGDGHDNSAVYMALMHCIDAESLEALLDANGHSDWIHPASPGPGQWRSDRSVEKMIILMGDMGATDPEPQSGYTLDDIVTAATARSIQIFTIVAGYGGGWASVPVEESFADLAEGTGGMTFDAGADPNQVVDAVMSAIQFIARVGPPIHVDSDCTLTGWNPDTNSWDLSTHNIMEDPNFVTGYYLSHLDADQDFDSPCIDLGSDLAAVLGLHTYTTRTDGVFDAGQVDMGYHYGDGLSRYYLNVAVLPDPCDGLIRGYVEPNSAIIYEGEDNVVTLTAYPDCNLPDYCYRVKKWTGTDDDSSTSTTNTVTVVEDTNVTVQFELPPKYNLTVVVGDHGSVYIDPMLEPNYDGSVVTLTTFADVVVDLIAIPDPGWRLQQWTGTDDDSSGMTTNTVTIDADKVVNIEFGQPEVIPVDDTAGPDALRNAVNAARSGDTLVVYPGTYSGGIDLGGKEGIHIVSSHYDDPNYVALTIIDCGSSGRAFTFDNGEDANTVINGFTIINGSLYGQPGGAIYIGPDASPTLANLVINDCTVTNADGGAIYVGANSHSVINNVTINNCRAILGDGGGVYIAADASPVFTWLTVNNCSAGGMGGAVYCQSGSLPTFTACAFNASSATYGGGVYYGPDTSSVFEYCAFNDNSATVGAGIYFDVSSDSQLTICDFNNNTADEEGGGVFYDQDSTVSISDCDFTRNTASYGAALYFYTNCSGVVVDSTLTDNTATQDGGAIYLVESGELALMDCDITTNTAIRGAGVYAIDSPQASITGCHFTSNEAASEIIIHEYYIPDPAWTPDPNDPNATAPLVPISPTDPNFNINDPNLVDVEHRTGGSFALGGGLYSFAGPTLIADCQFAENSATTSGGGIYFADRSNDPTILRNCLFADNSAGRDGAAVSNNWYSNLVISNCTMANNILIGQVSYGAGLYNSYASYASVIDTIFWQNSALHGSQIAVASGDWAQSYPSNVDISFSDIDRRKPEAPDYIDPDGWPVIREGFDANTLPANDDGSTGIVDIGFAINYYGILYSQLYVNNNGNVTFNSPMGTYTPWGLTTDIATPIIAPFFGDVDTWGVDPNDPNNSSKEVTFGTGIINGRPAFGVNWVDVGYFPSSWDKLNSFQLIIIDRSDRAHGDFDIEMNYEQIQWETGGASGGTDGFGGQSARAGFSNGTGEPGTFYEFEGSGIHSAFLDSNDTGLIYGGRNSNALGRYIFAVTAGQIELIAGDPIYVETACTLSGWDPNDPNALWDVPEGTIIDDDPCFTHGHYLSQPPDQNVTSLCIDVGSAPVGGVGMEEYTTNTTGANDVGMVDLGYHYRGAPAQYELTIIVIEDANDPGIHGTVDPNEGWFYEGTELTLQAMPDEGYYVKGWYDRDGTLISTERTLDVVMDSNQTYGIRFRWPREIFVSGGGDAIQTQINNAENGDVLVVAPDTYNGNIDLQGKELRLFGINPDEPNVVEYVVIDCAATGRGFIFDSGENAYTVIDGFKIINGNGSLPGGAIYVDNGSSPTIANVVISDCHLNNARGGAIYVGLESSPIFRNVTVTNCSVNNSDGGAVYVGFRSSPQFIGCSFIDCTVYGGDGAAVYCSLGTSTVFIDCSFVNGYAALLPLPGTGGAPTGGPVTGLSCEGAAIFYAADCVSQVTNCYFAGNVADDFGGAIFSGPDSSITITGSNFTDNHSDTSGGAVYFDANCTGEITNSVLVENDANDEGGAIYIRYSAISVADCNIAFNTATRGAGVFFTDSPDSTLVNCTIQYNQAYQATYEYYEPDPNDANVPLDSNAPLDQHDPNFDPNDPNLIVIAHRDDSLVAEGGGVFSFAGPMSIADCWIRFNAASTSGGGMYLGGGYSPPAVLKPAVTNCLITDNIAGRDGAGVSCNFNIRAAISNCTIVDNQLTGEPGYGGGLHCSYGSNVTLIDSIVWGNEGATGPQLAVASGDPVLPLPSELTVTYSDVSGGQPMVFVDTSCTLNWGDSLDPNSDPVDIYPNFTHGYYLTQPTERDETAPANALVDAGSADACDLGMHLYTTRIDGVKDANLVDIGYHYPDGLPRYDFSLTVIEDANGETHGSAEAQPDYTWLYAGAVVDLTAYPDADGVCGYRVKEWTNTDDDSSTALTNTATMDRDRHVTVEFERRPIRELMVNVVGGYGLFSVDPNTEQLTEFYDTFCEDQTVTLRAHPESAYYIKGWYDDANNLLSVRKTLELFIDSDYNIHVEFRLPRTITVGQGQMYETIQSGVNAAEPGDTVIVYGGTYSPPDGNGIDFKGKSITLRSAPATEPPVIDCGKNGRAFHFHSGEDDEAVVSGLIIKNGYVHGPVGATGFAGADPNTITGGDPNDPNDPNAPDPNGGAGGYGQGDSWGGGILCTNGSSPTFIDCTITNCLAAGGVGGRGGYSYSIFGGYGGNGEGTGHGGAVACLNNSNPTFEDCAIIRNRAVGGIAGTGGYAGLIYGYRGMGIGDGLGGGVYAKDSHPKFVNCTMSENVASDSDDILRSYASDFFNDDIMWVDYYYDYGLYWWYWPYYSYGTFYWVGGTGYGAGAYFDTGATADFDDCSFTKNKIRGKKWEWAQDPNSLDPNTGYYAYDPYWGYYYYHYYPTSIHYGYGAGLYCAENDTAILTDCVFASNRIGNQDTRRNRYYYEDTQESPTGSGNGGALYCGPDSRLTLSNCRVSENLNGVRDQGRSQYYSSSYYYYGQYDEYIVGGSGGGVYCAAGSRVDVNNGTCVFSNESTDSGGGFYFEPGCIVDMNDSFVLGNDANDSGGGMFCGAHSEISLHNSALASNKAAMGAGGAIYLAEVDVTSTIINCAINNNTAKRGGGLCWTGDLLTVADSTISSNVAEGKYEAGGGFYCLGSSATIENCIIADNNAPLGFGGGAYLAGNGRQPLIKNALIVGNWANHDGGGVCIDLMCMPTITNCTFADNAASAKGGALFSTNASQTAVIDSIFWGNTADANSAQIGLDFAGEADVSFCDVQGGYAGTGNIDDDPCFVGDYYLSQPPDQNSTSPCVNTGSDLALTLGFNILTTSTTNMPDIGRVDMGYHHRRFYFQLNTSVVGGHGFVAPLSRTYPALAEVTVLAVPERGYKVKKWTGTDFDQSTAQINVVTMDRDKSVTVEFAFAHNRTLTVPGDGQNQYVDLQAAINAARDGDIIILSQGVWPWGGFYIVDKVIMITSINPEDPTCVANTIIECNSPYEAEYPWQYSGSGGFYFGEGSGSSVLQGLTITGARGGYGGDWFDYYYYQGVVFDPYSGGNPYQSSWGYGGGAIYIDQGTSPVIKNCIISDAAIYGINGWTGGSVEWAYNGYPGGNGGGAQGGAIYVGPRSSPTITDCRITGCRVYGGNGGSGGSSGDFGYAGGRGGWPGFAYGGGIYCASGSTPVVSRCAIYNCQAIGGNGGDGGSGGLYGGYGGGWSTSGEYDYWYYRQEGYPAYYYYPSWYWRSWYYQDRTFRVDGELWEHWGFAAGPWYYSGHGGGVYCAADSKPTFVDCTISSNYADGGLAGVGGFGSYVVRENPIWYQDIPGSGGGIYCAAGSSAEFTRCDIVNNTVEDHGAVFQPLDPNDPFSGYDPNDPNAVAGHPSNPALDANMYQVLPGSGYGGGMVARDTLEICVEDCNIAYNTVNSGFGGGVYMANAGLKIKTSHILNNLAYKGGGFAMFEGWTEITACEIASNMAVTTGEGGGIYVFVTDLQLADSIIQYNWADMSGGGVYIAGDPNTVEGGINSIIRNCLIADNVAYKNGGGISSSWNARPMVSNCTIVNNYATGSWWGSVTGFGGGLYCSYGSEALVINSIVWGNNADRGYQFAVVDAGGYPQPSRLEVSHSDVRGGQAGVFVDPECTLIWGPENIDADPLFTEGPLNVLRPRSSYYLSQWPLQISDSPCVDRGSDLASELGMQQYTTRIDRKPDTGDVDLGYHYNIGRYVLMAYVVDSNATVVDPNVGHGSIAPSGELFAKNDVAIVTAKPDPGYRIKAWSGADDNNSVASRNYVTIDSDKTVTVEFEMAESFHVPGEYSTIGDALDTVDANGKYVVSSGDTIILAPGTYNEHDLDFVGRSITVVSAFPDDPCMVASTVINCGGAGRAFIFRGGEAAESGAVIEGLTIANGDAVGSSDTPWEPFFTHPYIFPSALDGAYGISGENAYGGAIASFGASSPTILNCVFVNCMARGRFGGDGIDGLDAPDAPPYPPERGGHGGSAGSGGDGYGGAFYFAAGSSPTIRACKFINCNAMGGNGGAGGNGGTGYKFPPDLEGSAPGGGNGGSGGYGGNAYGGVMYFENDCNVTIDKCVIEGCGTSQGEGNAGGSGGNGLSADGMGGNGGSGGQNGWYSWYGAMYYGPRCTVTVKDTPIANNTANDVVTTDTWAGGDAGVNADSPDDPLLWGIPGAAYLSWTWTFVGGNYYSTGCNVSLKNCNISYNTSADWGSGEFYEPNCVAEFDNCQFNHNSSGAGDGGSQYFAQGCLVDANNCSFAYNTAGGMGGALFYETYCDVTLRACGIGQNDANGHGGGIYLEPGCNLRIDDSSFTENTTSLADGRGGAIFFWEEASDINISATSFVRNQAAFGGALHWYGIDDIGPNLGVLISGCTIKDNTAVSHGGGLCWSNGAPTIENSFIMGNRSDGTAVSSAGLLTRISPIVELATTPRWAPAAPSTSAWDCLLLQTV
ncbi:MAG: right-handed parallel beta-helix repeat-containing protein [Planctomycetota bacterium]